MPSTLSLERAIGGPKASLPRSGNAPQPGIRLVAVTDEPGVHDDEVLEAFRSSEEGRELEALAQDEREDDW